MNNKYRIILWDVDGTLLNFLESERFALKEVFCHYGIEIDEEINRIYSEINESYWKRLEKREVTKEEVLRGRFVTLFKQFETGGSLEHKGINKDLIHKIDVDEFRQIYQKKLGSVYFYQDDSLNLCKKLKEEGYHQFIITNGVTWTQKNKLTLAGFYDLVDDVYISEEVGFHKPDIRFFDIVIERIKKKLSEKESELVELSQLLIVGDSQTSDMQLARNAGVDCCLYTNGGNKVTTVEGQEVGYQISNLWDIISIVLSN